MTSGLVLTGSQCEMCVWPVSYNRTCNQKIPLVTQPAKLVKNKWIGQHVASTLRSRTASQEG